MLTIKNCYLNSRLQDFAVAWDDGDSTGTEMGFDRVALDSTPKEDEIGVGTIVLFPQGRYRATEGSNEGGERWHQGQITKIEAGLFSGVHTEGPKYS